MHGRTAVTHGVEEGANIKCHACGWPLTPEESALPSYEHGVFACIVLIKLLKNKKLVSVCANHKLLPLNVNVYN
ncbi:hypothetical protein J696_02604 [Acinetobacter baumannii 1428368]|nr:hypothetical protein J696_02604 [Acinetobacter baumannii 1428368]